MNQREKTVKTHNDWILGIVSALEKLTKADKSRCIFIDANGTYRLWILEYSPNDVAKTVLLRFDSFDGADSIVKNSEGKPDLEFTLGKPANEVIATQYFDKSEVS